MTIYKIRLKSSSIENLYIFEIVNIFKYGNRVDGYDKMKGKRNFEEKIMLELNYDNIVSNEWNEKPPTCWPTAE